MTEAPNTDRPKRRRSGGTAVLPPADFRRPSPLSSDGLVVTHITEKGMAKATYDFSTLDVDPSMQAELAEVMAVRVKPTGQWRAISTSDQAWQMLLVLTRFMASQQQPPRSVSGITVALWKQWRLAQPQNTTGNRWARLSTAYLIEHPALDPDVRREMSQRLPRDQVKITSYTDEEMRHIKATAAMVFRKAEQRIAANLAHLDLYRTGTFQDGSQDYLIGEALEVILATGDAPTYPATDPSGAPVRRVTSRYQRALGGGSAEKTWKRLFLTSQEASALALLIACQHGWNYTSISELNVPDDIPTATDKRIYRVELEKRRRRAPSVYETRSIEDHGSGSEGRLFTRGIATTQPARQFRATNGQPTDRLLVWRAATMDWNNDPMSVIRTGLRSDDNRNWKRSMGLAINWKRIRKTSLVRHRRTPTQNTRDTYDETYVLSDQAAQEDAAPIIVKGVRAAIRHANATVLAAVINEDREAGGETATASCLDNLNSPFSESGSPCKASFLLCLGCSNAVIMPRHQGRLELLRTMLESLRGSISPAAWSHDWADHFDRLEDLRMNYFTEAEWTAALRSVSDQDRALVSHLLKGALDS